MNNGGILLGLYLCDELNNCIETLTMMTSKPEHYELDEDEVSEMEDIEQSLRENLTRINNLLYSGEKKETEYKPEEG